MRGHPLGAAKRAGRAIFRMTRVRPRWRFAKGSSARVAATEKPRKSCGA